MLASFSIATAVMVAPAAAPGVWPEKILLKGSQRLCVAVDWRIENPPRPADIETKISEAIHVRPTNWEWSRDGSRLRTAPAGSAQCKPTDLSLSIKVGKLKPSDETYVEFNLDNPRATGRIKVNPVHTRPAVKTFGGDMCIDALACTNFVQKEYWSIYHSIDKITTKISSITYAQVEIKK